jgi:RHS repeat-associated protein
VVDRGAFALVASDVRGSALASTDGRGELPSPYGDRASHPDIAASIDYAQKGFDPDLGVVRMGVRDYDPARNQFLEPDPLFLAKPENCVASPVECNLYGYAKSRPADHVDPSGTCSAPALEKGQVGTCFEAFIGSKWIGGIGRGDGRGFAANDPSLTARFTQRLVLDPAHGQILESNVSVHRSNVLLPGLGLKGFADELILPPYTDKDGAKHVDFSILAENGFFHLPGAPKDPIMAELGLRIGKDGRVDVTGGTRTAYPSMAMYSYRLDENGKLQTTTLFELKENNVSDLGHWGATIPSTIQKR